MFQTDLIISFLIIALLFIRQVMILKLPNKISYLPIILGVGVVSSLIHFIINPQQDPLLLFRESLFPFLFALLLYLVMNIMQQNQESENAKYKEDLSETIVEQIDELKRFVSDLETRMLQYSQEDRAMQENIREQFKNDVKVLDQIAVNQTKFLTKFDEVEQWHQRVSKALEDFIEVQVPELDKVVHKHIDLLRVSEQDHYNRLKLAIESRSENTEEIEASIKAVQNSVETMSKLSSSISKSVVHEVNMQLSDLTKSYKGDIITLKSHAEGMKTILFEGENKITTMKMELDEIYQTLQKSSDELAVFSEKSDELQKFSFLLKGLLKDVEAVKDEYQKSQSKLYILAQELKERKYDSSEEIEKYMEELTSSLTQKIDRSLEKLEKHYHIVDDDVTHSMQLLSQKAKLQKEYKSTLGES